MQISEGIHVRDLKADATLYALNAAIEEAGIETERIISVHYVSGLRSRIKRPEAETYRVFYRN